MDKKKSTFVHNARERRCHWLQADRSTRAVARVFGVHHSTVVFLAERFQISNGRLRSGRPHVTTAAKGWANRLSHLCDRFRPATRTTAETIGTHKRQVSARTIRNRLQADGIRPYHFIVWSCYCYWNCHKHRLIGSEYQGRVYGWCVIVKFILKISNQKNVLQKQWCVSFSLSVYLGM